MARKTVVVSDLSGETIEDAREPRSESPLPTLAAGLIEMDVTAEEARAMGAKGRPVARRGRKPKGS